MWRSLIDGLRLTFHLAGINNQNFLMRDDQTGTYWQQISGRAISGPLAGRQLTLVHSDELTYSLWTAEQPNGTVLDDDPALASQYAPLDWDVRMQKARTVLSFPGSGHEPRELMLGIAAFGASRAFPYNAVLHERLVQDQVGGEPILLVVGADNQSVRAFRRRIDGASADFYYIFGGMGDSIVDTASGSRWNFQGCATAGKSLGKCLQPIEVIQDYWFDWRNYHHDTSVYAPKQ